MLLKIYSVVLKFKVFSFLTFFVSSIFSKNYLYEREDKIKKLSEFCHLFIKIFYELLVGSPGISYPGFFKRVQK